MTKSLLMLLMACAVVCGCASRQTVSQRILDMKEGEATATAVPPPDSASAARTRKEAPVLVASTALTGKIMRVDKRARFAVVSFPLGRLPANEQRLSVYREGLKVGEVKITGPQRDDKTVADIVAGDCDAGDQVSDR